MKRIFNMRRWLAAVIVLVIIAAAAASAVTSQYMINDRPLSGLEIGEYYDLHAALVAALTDAVEAEHESTPYNKWTWVVNEGTRKFHYPYCLSALEITGDKTLVQCSAESLVEQGYQPCGRCDPYVQ